MVTLEELAGSGDCPCNVCSSQTESQVCILTEEEIISFQKLARETMGIELTLAEAEDQGSRLIQSMELILENKKRIIAKQVQKGENKEEDGQ